MSDKILDSLRLNKQALNKQASQYWLVQSLVKRLSLASTCPVGIQTFSDIWESLLVTVGCTRLLMLTCSMGYTSHAWPESTKILSEAMVVDEEFLSEDDSLPKCGQYNLCLFLVGLDCELPKWQRSAISKIRKTTPVLIVVEDANTLGREFGDVFDYCEKYIAEDTKGKPVLVTDGERMSLLMKAFELVGPRLLKTIGWGSSKCVCEELAKMLTGYVAEVTLLQCLTENRNSQVRCTFTWIQRLLVSLILVYTIPFSVWKTNSEYFEWLTTYVESDDVREVLHRLAKRFWKSALTLSENNVVTKGRTFIQEVGKHVNNCFTSLPDNVEICEHIQKPEFNLQLCKELQSLSKAWY